MHSNSSLQAVALPSSIIPIPIITVVSTYKAVSKASRLSFK